LPAKPGRRARDAVFAVRFTEMTLARPRHGRREEGPDSVALTVVDVREVAAPVRWRLLTSHAVTTVAEAFEVVELYRRRWAIEQLFRTMKSKGFDIEGLRCRLVTATLIAAITIQQLVYARLGGWTGYYGKPGPIVMLNGWLHFQAAKTGANLMKQKYDV